MPLAGVIGYVLLMAAGYAYNLTFVQLGIAALARDRLGLADDTTAVAMGALAVITCAVALTTGWAMAGWSFRRKVAVAAVAVGAQTALTWATGLVWSGPALGAWLLGAGCALGVAVPATFGLATDLVPVAWRGLTAAGITASAYAGAIAFLGVWDVAALTPLLVPLMAAGTLGLAALAAAPGPLGGFVAALGRQHRDPRYAQGRFADPAATRRLVVAAALLFGVFFVDSLGFVRLTETGYVTAAWQSPDVFDRGALVAAHVLGALAAGVLYATFDERLLLPWVFGIFALVALMYVLDVRIGAASQALAMPLLYAVGVSLYTVLTFALWPDLSTPATVTRVVAVGVALSGWSATFLSTALAVAWRTAGVDLDRHLSTVAGLALLALSAIALRWLLVPARVAR